MEIPESRMVHFPTYPGQLNIMFPKCLISQETVQPDTSQSSSTPTEALGGRGRHRSCITQSQLEYLKSLKFTWSEITAFTGVSRMTLYRRSLDCGMLDEDPSVSLTEAELKLKLY